jgi:hypothetical protein
MQIRFIYESGTLSTISNSCYWLDYVSLHLKKESTFNYEPWCLEGLLTN